MPKTISNVDCETDTNMFAIALLPHGRGMMKMIGKKQSEIAPSRVVNHPKVFSDDFLTAVPIGSKNKGTERKKAIAANPCNKPVGNGNIPRANRAHMARKRNDVPKRPNRVFNIRLFLIPIANTIPVIPAIVSPTLKITEAVPRATHSGVSPTMPARSLR